MYDKLVKKVKAINTSGLIEKADCDANISDIESKIPSITGLAITSALNAVGDTQR